MFIVNNEYPSYMHEVYLLEPQIWFFQQTKYYWE